MHACVCGVNHLSGLEADSLQRGPAEVSLVGEVGQSNHQPGGRINQDSEDRGPPKVRTCSARSTNMKIHQFIGLANNTIRSTI